MKKKKNVLFFLVALAVFFVSKPSFEIAPSPGPTVKNPAVSPSSGNIGTIFKITVEVSDVSGVSSVVANIHEPYSTSTIDSVPLYDDGMHSDGAANDGVYGNTWNSTGFSPPGPGTYVLFIDVKAIDTLGHSTEKKNLLRIKVINAPSTPTPSSTPSPTGFTVSITSPPDGDAISKGTAINFNSSVSGGTPPYSFLWVSSIDGNIGNTQNFTKSDLSVGDHKITLTVTDSLGNTATTSIEIHIPPESWDWRDVKGKNWMTSVKLQACGDCTIFATLGVMEAKYKIEQNLPDLDIDLSEQYVLECYGKASLAMMGLMSKGTPEENCHPYKGSAGCSDPCPTTCDDKSPLKFWKVTNINMVLPKPVGDRADLQYALIKYGPLYVEIRVPWAGPTGRKDKDGCDILKCGHGVPNHAVVLVGYDDKNQYWIIKNSWGAVPFIPCLDGYESIDYSCLQGLDLKGTYLEGIVPPS